MRFTPVRKTPSARTEQIILFRSSNQIFAISSAAVQEVRSIDSLAGASIEIDEASVPKVRHLLKRGEYCVYVVNAALHFGLRPSPTALIFLLRKTRVGLLIDGIEKMTTMTHLQALSPAFCHEEREWYRGLTVLDQNVIPVVNPQGFLTQQELLQLDATTGALLEARAASAPEVGLTP
jgi:chemotaxis signal transduction protein